MICTFKKDTAPTGLARVGWAAGCDVKFKKLICGRIYPPNNWLKESQYKLALQVKDGDTWKWVTLKARFNSLNEAKAWCNANWNQIMQKFELHFREE